MWPSPAEMPPLPLLVLPSAFKRLLEFASRITKGCFHFLSVHPPHPEGLQPNPSRGLLLRARVYNSVSGDAVYRWHLRPLNLKGQERGAREVKGMPKPADVEAGRCSPGRRRQHLSIESQVNVNPLSCKHFRIYICNRTFISQLLSTRGTRILTDMFNIIKTTKEKELPRYRSLGVGYFLGGDVMR